MTGPGTLFTSLLSLTLATMVLACRPATLPHPSAAQDASLRVMTFNIRYDNRGDGINAWPNRKEWVASLMRWHDADVIGVQEALHHQLTDLDTRLPGFSRVGVGRTDGRLQGEFSAIFYRTARIALRDSGTFWLSPTPERPGSKGWDTAIERIATWAHFTDRRTGCEWLQLNTHFDHIGETARQESARLIRRRLAQLAKGLPIVMTGDLNTEPKDAPYRILTTERIDDAVPPLHDAFLVSRTGSYGPTSSWNAFKAIEPNRRIDYVLVSAPVNVEQHAILPDMWDGRFPSDHLPVMAEVNGICR